MAVSRNGTLVPAAQCQSEHDMTVPRSSLILPCMVHFRPVRPDGRHAYFSSAPLMTILCTSLVPS